MEGNVGRRRVYVKPTTNVSHFVGSTMEVRKQFAKPISDDSIILICVIKNEALLLEYFLKHYLSIGVTHCIFVDNNSSDNSLEILKRTSANCMVFHTSESYKAANFGITWVTSILNRYCKQKWCIVVDADELIYVPDIRILQTKMKQERATMCGFYLLDMYSKEESNTYVPGDSFLSHSKYYDKETDNNKDFYSGVRKRIFGTNACLHKRSFFYYNFSCCCRLRGGYHGIDELVPGHSCIQYFRSFEILLHFKFLKPNLREFFQQRVLANEDWNNSSEYKEYCKRTSFHLFDERVSVNIHTTPPQFPFLRTRSIREGSHHICYSIAS